MTAGQRQDTCQEQSQRPLTELQGVTIKEEAGA